MFSLHERLSLIPLIPLFFIPYIVIIPLPEYFSKRRAGDPKPSER